MNSDLVSLIADNENEIVKLQRVVGGKAPVTTNLDMGGHRILNVAHPRNLREYESDLVTSKILYDYMSKVDQNYMGGDRDGSLNGRLNMTNHRISGLADPTDADDAVTRSYVASLFQALSDEVQGIGDNKRKLDVLQNLLGVENNQVLLMKYELMDVEIKLYSFNRSPTGRIVDALFERSLREVDSPETYETDTTTTTYLRGYLDGFELKENLISHLFEEPVDTVTWLKIKQPGTYTIHFDLIYSSSFSFELHTRDEIIHFSEHYPKHDINLEKDENCVLVYKQIPTITRAGSKIYVYYNI